MDIITTISMTISQRNKKMVDFHSHFLPNVDDGADSLECSLEILECLNKQGVDNVVATPHFYADRESIREFLSRRQFSHELLRKELETKGQVAPKILLGAEVALNPETPKDKDLERLCIENTNVILVELPYGNYQEWMTYAIYEIISRKKLHPVIAHFERFCTDKKMLKIYETLLSLEISVQINADSFLDKHNFKTIKHFVKKGIIDVIGSDVHNNIGRKSNLDKAKQVIERKFGKEYFAKLNENALKLLNLM